MILVNMILLNTDFGDDFGDDPPTPPVDGAIFHMDPFYLLGAAVIIGIIVGIIAGVMYLARNRAQRRVRSDCEASAKAIYDCVKYHLDRALRAPGSSILDRGREVADVLDARLGAVLALDGRVGKPLGELAKALKGEKPKPKAEGAAKVKVQRPTDEHTLEVWKALQKLNAFWSDRPMVLALLVAAQKELVTMPAPLPPVIAALRPGAHAPEKVVKAKEKKQSLWDEIPDTRRDERKKKAAKPIKVPAPIVMPKPAATDDGPPEPPPTPPPAPRPSGKKKKDLPVHKRNMLA